MYVETVKVPINKLETFHDTLIKGATDLGNQYDTIISTCGKIVLNVRPAMGSQVENMILS